MNAFEALDEVETIVAKAVPLQYYYKVHEKIEELRKTVGTVVGLDYQHEFSDGVCLISEKKLFEWVLQGKISKSEANIVRSRPVQIVEQESVIQDKNCGHSRRCETCTNKEPIPTPRWASDVQLRLGDRCKITKMKCKKKFTALVGCASHSTVE